MYISMFLVTGKIVFDKHHYSLNFVELSIKAVRLSSSKNKAAICKFK